MWLLMSALVFNSFSLWILSLQGGREGAGVSQQRRSELSEISRTQSALLTCHFTEFHKHPDYHHPTSVLITKREVTAQDC